MPINGHPFLDYALSALADAGLRDLALVVAPEHEALQGRYAREMRPARISVSFVVQSEARGTADALLAVERWTAGEPFLVMNADNLYPVTALRELAALDEPGLPGFDADDLVKTSNIPAGRIASFALIQVDRDGYLTAIEEKPQHVETTAPRISMNCWRFDSRIFGPCRDVPRSTRGEFELPEAVGLAVRRGVRFHVVPARGPVLDLSRRADATELERRLRGVTPVL